MADGWPDFVTVPWNDLYPRLLAMALGRIRFVSLRGVFNETSALTSLAEDLVQTAVLKAMSGDRTYDRNKSLFQNLCQIISSEASNAVNSADNRSIRYAHESEIKELTDPNNNPEENFRDKQWVEHLLIFLKNRDREAMVLADYVLNHHMNSSLELLVQMSTTVKDIENAKKRLRRLFRLFLYVQSPSNMSLTTKLPVNK